jgi:ABC-type protease/lipase transport system fused ATPase/permease subunit
VNAFRISQKGNLGIGGRLAYLLAAWVLLSIGVIFMFFFWAIVPAILGLLCWFGAVIFVTLAIHGMSYADWDAERKARSSLAKQRKSELVEQKKSD